MKSKSGALALPVRERRAAILSLAIPIIAGMASQTVLNLVDTFMVSRLGPHAVAAVGLASTANFMLTAFITGLAVGVQAAAARRKGEGRITEMAIPLNGGLVIVAAIAIPSAVALYFLAEPLFRTLHDDPAVVAAGVPYLKARVVGILALGCNFAFRGYWNGVSLSKLYLRTLVVMHVSNIVLSYWLIFGGLGLPGYGVVGAGLGTMLSTYIGTAYYVMLGVRHARNAGFLAGWPSRDSLATMLRLSVPSGLQQFVYAAGVTALFYIIGLIGTAELAAANVILNMRMFAFLPGLGMGLTASSLVGQALGRGDTDDAERWGWEVSKLAVLVVATLALPMVVAPEWVLGLFFPEGGEPVAVGVWPLRIAGITAGFEAVGVVLQNSMMGAGATRLSMLLSVSMQWGLLLPMALVAGPWLGFGILGVWLANLVYRLVDASVCATIWRRRTWAGVRL